MRNPIKQCERTLSQRAAITKDVEQAAALIEWHVDQGRLEHFQATWVDVVERGPGWRKRAEEGRASQLRRHPFLSFAGRDRR